MPKTRPTDPASPGSRLQRNRERIYQAAIELFAERGPDAVTMDDIAAAAGMARSSVFNHFASKTRLLGEFYARMTEDILAKARDRGTHTFRAGLEELGRAAASEAIRHGQTVAAIAVRTAPRQPLAATEQVVDDAMMDYLLDLVRDGQSRGEVRRDRPADALASLILAVMTASAHEWVGGGRRSDLSALLVSRFSLLADGMMQKT